MDCHPSLRYWPSSPLPSLITNDLSALMSTCLKIPSLSRELDVCCSANWALTDVNGYGISERSNEHRHAVTPTSFTENMLIFNMHLEWAWMTPSPPPKPPYLLTHPFCKAGILCYHSNTTWPFWGGRAHASLLCEWFHPMAPSQWWSLLLDIFSFLTNEGNVPTGLILRVNGDMRRWMGMSPPLSN